MPTDLRDLYAALSADTDAAVLGSAASVRRRADRHARTVVVAACVGAAVAAGGIAVIANGTLSGHKAPTPADSPSPAESPVSPAPSLSPSPSPTSSPSPLASQQIVPPADAPIPDRAFLTPPANRTRTHAPPYDRPSDLSPPCGATYPSDREIGRQRNRSFIVYEVSDVPNPVPLETVDQTIAVYEPGGAEAAMAEKRAAVLACPTEKRDNGVKLEYELLTTQAWGDDAILIQQTWTRPPQPPDSPPYPPVSKSLISIVRIGDVVTTLYATSWEDWAIDPSVTQDYTDLAVQAIEKWRK